MAPAERMSKFLKHFTVVGDDYHAWNINYKKWENEEEEEEEEQPPPTEASASAEEGRATDPTPAPAPVPRPRLDFRTTLRKLFSAHRFQVGGQRPKMPWVGQSHQPRVTRSGGRGPISVTSSVAPQIPTQHGSCAGRVPCCQGQSKS